MASGRKAKKERRQEKVQKRDWRRLVAHPAFAPALGLWGALLGGLAVMVVPAPVIAAFVEGTLIATFDVPAQPVFAAAAALLVGMALFIPAMLRSAEERRRLRPGSILDVVARKVNPIDPVRDLGGKSIDDPIEPMPFASPAWRDADLEARVEEEEEREAHPLPRFVRKAAPAADVEAEAEAEAGGEAEAPRADVPAARDADAERLPPVVIDPLPEPVAQEDRSAPLELDLAAFAELPGRNAVWVEEPAAAAPAVAAEPVPPAAEQPEPLAPRARTRRAAPPAPPLPGTAALARLRAVPTSDLSMAEMVERFAAALHQHRTSAPVRTLGAAELAAREAALAEALKALATLSGIGGVSAADDQDDPLRAALSQLQPRRDAAA